MSDRDYDVFICHASEDKSRVVRPLAAQLSSYGLRVWYDEFTLKPGDSIRRSIDAGLARSRTAVVVLSPHFFGKGWTEWELNGIVQRHTRSKDSMIIPVWHKLDSRTVASFSPSLADIVAISTRHGVRSVARQIAGLLLPSRQPVYVPSFSDFAALARSHKCVPVFRTLLADVLTPVQSFLNLTTATTESKSIHDCAYLLESVVGSERVGRFSLLGVNPLRVVRSNGTTVEVVDVPVGETRTFEQADPLAMLEEVLREFGPPHIPGLPPLAGSAVGYISYNAACRYHDPSSPRQAKGVFPDVYLCIFETELVFDHVSRTCMLINNVDCRADDLHEAYRRATTRNDELVELLLQPVKDPLPEAPCASPGRLDHVPTTSEEQFLSVASKCRQYIAAGDISQIVVTLTSDIQCQSEPFTCYRRLRSINYGPFMFYLQFPHFQLVGSSPELLLRVLDGEATLRPVSGASGRDGTTSDDMKNAEGLLADPEERARHTMLIDQARGDLGVFCRYRSIRLTDVFVVDRDAKNLRVSSNVEGTLRPDVSSYDAIRTVVPAGANVGHPRTRATEIIEEVENEVRFPFGGILGMIASDESVDMCTLTGAILMNDGRARAQCGVPIHASIDARAAYRDATTQLQLLLGLL